MGQERQDTNASPESPSLLEPDRAALEIFVDAIFRHAGTQGFVSLRGFFEGDASKPFRITPVSLAGDLKFLVDAAEDDARRAALDPKAVVFAPPLAVFAIKERAREKDIALGLALSVELDQDPQQAREQLEQLLGPATITVKSGGLWTDPKTGEIHDKLHLHWRLAKPAAQGVAIAKLKEARDLAARLVGGDPSNKPVCHPIRWPGSWHRKAAPRLCAIETANPDAEIDLDAALATLIVPPLHVDRPQGTRNGNADPGTGAGDWGELVGNIIAGENLHASITPLAMKLLRAGMMDVAAVRLLRGILDSSSAPRDTRWQTRWDYVPRAVSSARAKLDEQATTAADRAIHWHGEIDTAASRAWLLQDLLPEVGKGLVAGQWGTYKTFTVFDIAYSVMTGVPFLGFEVTRLGGVLFIALEGQSEVAIRLQGVINHKGGGKPQRAPFAWIETCPPLLAGNAVGDLSKITDQVATKLKADFDLPLAMIVIDTMVLAAGYTKDGADNDTATTNAVLLTMSRLAARAGCFVFGVDHFGKNVDVGTRGNSVKEGNADVVLALLGDKAITGEVSNSRLALRKRRGGANGQEFPFTPRVVDMGCDRNGRPMTTLVLDWGQAAATLRASKDDWGKGKGLKLLRRIVMSLLVDQGVELKPWADSPMVRALKLETVRAEFFKAHYVAAETEKAKQNAKRMAFQRAVEAAVGRGVIATREIGGTEYVWLTSAHAEMHAHAKG
jgi:AAA domain